jgi:hypothetical protein
MRAPRPRPRTFRALLARLVLVRTAVLALVAAVLVLGHTLSTAVASHGLVPYDDPQPAWTGQETLAFPGCVATTAWDRTQVPSALVVHVFRDEERVRMAFDRAWRLNHNKTEVDDVQVLGACP